MPTTTSSINPTLVPRTIRYAWVKDLSTQHFLANARRESVRIQGTWVGVKDMAQDEQPLIPLLTTDLGYDETEIADCYQIMTIDDGTGSIDRLWVESTMLEQFHVGQTLDCYLRLRQNGVTRRWFVEYLRVITAQEEHQWWALRSHQERCSHHSMYSHTFGVPTRKRDTTELYRLTVITVHAQIQQKRLARQQNKTKKTFVWKQQQMRMQQQLQQQQQQTSGVLLHKKLKGLTLQDLSMVMGVPESAVQEMVTPLQWDGRVYQNAAGEYLPL